MARTYLAVEAMKHGKTEKELVKEALQKAGSPYGAAQLIGISTPSITAAMKRYGLHVEKKMVVSVTEDTP